MNILQEGHASSSIVIIEDNAAQLKTLTDILITEGLQPIGCSSGKDALETCRAHDAHVAILDLRLPDMDGIDVLNQLKQQVPDMKVIINTAYATLESAMEAVNQDAFAYVQKMGDVEELLRHVHRAFHTHLADYSERLEQEVRKRTTELSEVNRTLTHEIEERKQAEEAIRQLNEELELRVRQRTAELESLNQELKDFTYTTSHELQAPLRGINNLAHWIVEDYTGTLDEKGQEMFALLIGRVKRMEKLIDGLLHYSRVGRIVGKDEQLDLNLLVQELIAMLEPPEHVHIRIQNDLPVMIGDCIRIEQIFRNLIGNAIRFLDKPDGCITLNCVDDGAFWKFSVSDNGPGIDARHHARIFRIFTTAASRDSDEHLGVGLALVKKIVAFYGGTIWLESEPGEGSSFFFTLPKPQ